MTKLEMEMLESLLVKYMQEADENGLINTFDHSKLEKTDEVLTAVKRAECFIYSFMPGKKD